MPAPITLPAQLAGGRPFTVAEAVAAGLDTDALRGQAVRRVIRGVYADSRSEPTAAQLHDAIELRCPGAVWIGEVAAALWGLPVPLASVEPLPHVLLPPGSHQRTSRGEYRVSVGRSAADDVTVVGGRRVLRPAPLLLWLARDWDLVDLVALGDVALSRRLMSLSSLDGALAAWGPQPGVDRAKRARGLLSPRSKSPMESRLRVRFVLAGLPTPQVNLMVTTAPPGYRGPEVDTLGELDLAWKEAKVGVEYDGEDHARPRARSNDSSKRRLFARHGWEVIPVTAWDYFNRLDAVIAEVRAQLRARGVDC